MNARARRRRSHTRVPCEGMWKPEKITEPLLLKTARSLALSLSLSTPSSSLALSTARLIQWGGFVRKAPTRCAQGARLRISCASEGQRRARQLPQQQDAVQVKLFEQGRGRWRVPSIIGGRQPQIHLGVEFRLALSAIRALDTCAKATFGALKRPRRIIHV